MRDSMQSAVFGALSNEHRLAMTANNLANVNTTGFKVDRVAFHDTFTRFAHDYLVSAQSFVRDDNPFPDGNVLARPRLSDMQTDLNQGSLQLTGNPLDIAINGEGFFKIRTPEGDFYSRNGHFLKAADGTIMNAEGHPVLFAGAPLQVPSTGTLYVSDNGTISVDGEEIGAFDVVTLDNLEALEKKGENLYQIRKGMEAGEIPVVDTRIEQGMLEKSNVEVVMEMVNMIELQRGFEMYTKMMSSTDTMDSTAIRTGSVVG